MNELTPGALRLLMFLRYCLNSETGKCCPSVRVCAEGVDVHAKNIFRLRRELSEKGFVTFDGDHATFLINAQSSKNATAGVANKEDAGRVAKTLPDGSGNATTVAKTLLESQKCYPMVAKTLPDGSENATAYKEEHTKEHTKEQSAERAREAEGANGAKPPRREFSDEPPFSSVSPSTPPTPIEAMTDTVYRQYAITGNVDSRFERQIVEEVGRLNGCGCTPASLLAFFKQRTRLPSLNHIVKDWVAWNANEQRAQVATNGANSTHSSRPPLLAAPSGWQASKRKEER